MNIKRYTIGQKPKSTSGCKLAFVAPKELKNTPTVWLCEGEWDGMALWEALREAEVEDDILCAPGASVIPNAVLDMLSRRRVIVVYDHDEAGFRGCAKLYKRLDGLVDFIRFVHCGDDMP